MEIGNFTKIRKARKVGFNVKTILFRLFDILKAYFIINLFQQVKLLINLMAKSFDPVEKLNWKKMSHKVPNLNVVTT